MVFEDICNTDLSLGSGSIDPIPGNSFQSHHSLQKKRFLSLRFKDDDHVFPSLALGLSSEVKHQASNSLSAVSSYSNSSVKRERELSGEEVEIGRVISSKVSDDDDDDDDDDQDLEESMISARKKLRLTKQQSVILEDKFKEHTTLNPKQKLALAKQLNLRPRQVEVWFQNRRARTKLKQTEVECELLKKHCETLSVENRRLQKELQELKSLKTVPFYMQLPAASTMCPSCERIGSGDKYFSKSAFSIGANKPHFYNPFTHPPAAC